MDESGLLGMVLAGGSAIVMSGFAVYSTILYHSEAKRFYGRLNPIVRAEVGSPSYLESLKDSFIDIVDLRSLFSRRHIKMRTDLSKITLYASYLQHQNRLEKN